MNFQYPWHLAPQESKDITELVSKYLESMESAARVRSDSENLVPVVDNPLARTNTNLTPVLGRTKSPAVIFPNTGLHTSPAMTTPKDESLPPMPTEVPSLYVLMASVCMYVCCVLTPIILLLCYFFTSDRRCMCGCGSLWLSCNVKSSTILSPKPPRPSVERLRHSYLHTFIAAVNYNIHILG